MKEPDAAVDALLTRMRDRLYPETLPVLASCWLKTVCSAGHNRPWWVQLTRSMDRTLHLADLDPFARAVLLSARDWTSRALANGGELSSFRPSLEPPFRSIPPERLVAYSSRLLNEWLPAEVSSLLTDEDGVADPSENGVPVLAVARALHRLLARERLSPETLEMFLTPGPFSPKLVYPADVEVLRDVVLALLGRLSAPALPILPAMLLAPSGAEAIPAAHEEEVRRVSLETLEGREELHVPITDSEALQILSHDPVRIESVIVTMDGRAWRPWTLHRGEQTMIVYRPGDRLRIDSSADHARLTVPWPERPLSWPGAVAMQGPFELFGREWRPSSWEMDNDSTLLHLTFSRVMHVEEATLEAVHDHLRPASVEMAWSELERALADSVSRKSPDGIEQMRRGELIPLGRALFALAETLQSNWPRNAKQIDTQLRAVRYHQASVASTYGRAPWRILPTPIQASLAKRRLAPDLAQLLPDIFSEIPKPFDGRGPTQPSQAA